MRVVLTGGGTGGHVIPNLAVIEELRKYKDIEILYVGSRGGIEEKIIEKLAVDYRGVSCGKLRRYFSPRNFVDFFKVPVGMWQAYRVLLRFGADVVFSKGGFVSVPVVLAASLLKIPVIIHESDVVPGLANKLCARFADKICVSFEETRFHFSKYAKKVVFTGNPVRKSILDGDKNSGYKFTGLDKHRPVILLMGGSQGARQINELVRASLSELLKKFQIVHICGRGNLDVSLHKKGYVQYEYLDEQFADIYAICEMVVSRGGANSLAEIAALKKKALIIPLGKDVSRGDQIENTRIYVHKFGWTSLSGNIRSEDFIKTVELTYKNDMNVDEDFKNGTDEIVKLILKIGK